MLTTQFVIPATIEDATFEIIVNYTPGKDVTYFEPGYIDEVEILDIFEDDVPDEFQDTSYNEFWDLLFKYERDGYCEMINEIAKLSE